MSHFRANMRQIRFPASVRSFRLFVRLILTLMAVCWRQPRSGYEEHSLFERAPVLHAVHWRMGDAAGRTQRHSKRQRQRHQRQRRKLVRLVLAPPYGQSPSFDCWATSRSTTRGGYATKNQVLSYYCICVITITQLWARAAHWLQCHRSTQPSTLRGTVNEYKPYGWVIIPMAMGECSACSSLQSYSKVKFAAWLTSWRPPGADRLWPSGTTVNSRIWLAP